MIVSTHSLHDYNDYIFKISDATSMIFEILVELNYSSSNYVNSLNI